MCSGRRNSIKEVTTSNRVKISFRVTTSLATTPAEENTCRSPRMRSSSARAAISRAQDSGRSDHETGEGSSRESSSTEEIMSIFPTKILLATDGSEEASLAATAAARLATKTGSGLHVLTVGSEYPYYELPDYPARFEEVVEAQRRETREVLNEQLRKIEESGATVEEAHLEMGIPPGRAIVHLGEELGAGVVVVGS